ncbi:2-isopropylmalate synthase [Pseudonocardia alaniniphila]|uniref:2-isopropylmalate synthase n=1 Tax=Pseudonocardia alaniniphila TaxID=75291 RepID=A0ABS9TD23_9PSEU|nr:2-isopropylmalate synthase [Pseudonocardia alaniniphila]MCH6166445.1 2-isopropylmalate synthase [Pseudonocardia alaniniphila]
MAASPSLRPSTSSRTPRGPRPATAPWWNRQRGSAMPSHRYRPAHHRVDVPLTDRTWPERRITEAPLWVPVDLRDGNQALVEPMDLGRKRQFFELLVGMGFTEIEVGYPSASQVEFDFVREIADERLVPEDVTAVVFTPARAELIDRTIESISGLRRVVVHLYTATAPLWRNTVIGEDRVGLARRIRDAAERIARAVDGWDAEVRFEFSPEVFNLTEPDFALEVCNMVTQVWDADRDRPVIHNLPATVEISTPNVYADQIEFMHRNLDRREAVILSVHPHNDRGTGVACAELALMAGAQRVEGCLFGNGERTGNVDLVTLALNLHTQGVDPQIDFSDIDEIRRVVEHCNRISVHERHPYGGDLVHTAFSGTHQDAIKKGFARHAALAAERGISEDELAWDVPYLPIDPAELGRTYEAVIRVNSQSGKGGIAYLLQSHAGLVLPRRLQIDFAAVVQRLTDRTGAEISPEELWSVFQQEYVEPGTTSRPGAVDLHDWGTWQLRTGQHLFAAQVSTGGPVRAVEGTAAGPLAGLAEGLAAVGIDVDVLDFQEQTTSPGRESVAAAYALCRVNGVDAWGVGLDASVLTASVHAVIAAVNRAAPEKLDGER